METQGWVNMGMCQNKNEGIQAFLLIQNDFEIKFQRSQRYLNERTNMLWDHFLSWE